MSWGRLAGAATAAAGLPTAGDPTQSPGAESVSFRFGDGFLDFASDDALFRSKFLDLYRDCISGGPRDAAIPIVGCRVRLDDGGPVRVLFDDPEPLENFSFSFSTPGAFHYDVRTPADADGWRPVRYTEGHGRLDIRGGDLRADPESPWQSLAASLALHRVLRRQRGSLFLHAASVGIRGAGALLSGPKGAGKTTLSLALADAGHQFLGDEISAVRTRSLELVPMWRRLSIRPGPAGPSVTRALERGGLPVSHLTDGTHRFHLHIGGLHPQTAWAPVPLRAIVVLRDQGVKPALEPFTPRAADIQSLVPFESATWAADPRSVAMQILSLLGRVRCYTLDIGPIPDTIRLLETLPE